MASRNMLRSAMLIEPILLRPLNFNSNKYHIASRNKCDKLRTITIRSRNFRSPKPPFSSSQSETPSSHADEDPPQDAVFKAISDLSKVNVVTGSTSADDSNDQWMALDQKVNSYPTVRRFTAIGIGGDDFVQAMVVAVESVIQSPIPQGNVKQKLSSGGKYVSVNIGPIQVVSSEQVQAVYNAMRRDDRVKYFL